MMEIGRKETTEGTELLNQEKIRPLKEKEYYKYLGVTLPPLGPQLQQLLRTISLLYGRWSTSGSDRGNAHFFTATSNTIEGAGEKREQTNNTNKILSLTQVQKESYVTLCGL